MCKEDIALTSLVLATLIKKENKIKLKKTLIYNKE